MPLSFYILTFALVASAVAAMALRNLVHCALALTVAFGALAGLFLQLNAEFAGWAQILVYVGAVAILIVFAILLTRGAEPSGQPVFASGWRSSLALALGLFALLTVLLLSSKALPRDVAPVPVVTVRDIGDQLMTRYVLPLDVMGLLLTAALIGAVVIALREPAPADTDDPGDQKNGGGRGTSHANGGPPGNGGDPTEPGNNPGYLTLNSARVELVTSNAAPAHVTPPARRSA